MTWIVPHRILAKLADSENWSEAKRKALMEHHEYHITKIEATDGLVMLKAYYRGYS